ncbi:hypothetical protein ACFL6S_23090 [Candidatus Poribacteria bacterium]
MQMDREAQNLLQLLSQIGRTIRQTTIIDNNPIIGGAMASRETTATVDGGNVEIDETTFVRVLGCAHISSPESITAVCDFCGRWVCGECLYVCSSCNHHVCNRCCREYSGKEAKEILCSTCLWDAKRRDNLKKGFNFFVKMKEDD